MSYANYSREEVVARGKAIYEQNIRPMVEAGNIGKFLVLDIESGDYEIDDEDEKASRRILARHPEGVLYGLRIGFAAAYRLGNCVGRDLW